MSAQPHFRSRAQRRERDAELERLVAAELDACDAPEPAPANLPWVNEVSAAERDFVDLVRQWLERRPNKHQLMHLIWEGVALSDNAASMTQPSSPPEQTSSVVEQSLPGPSVEPDSHAAP